MDRWVMAPEWANYIAMDECGIWVWHSNVPRKRNRMWGPRGMSEAAMDIPTGGSVPWDRTLEKRP